MPDIAGCPSGLTREPEPAGAELSALRERRVPATTRNIDQDMITSIGYVSRVVGRNTRDLRTTVQMDEAKTTD